jgi:hypothetical protein
MVRLLRPPLPPPPSLACIPQLRSTHSETACMMGYVTCSRPIGLRGCAPNCICSAGGHLTAAGIVSNWCCCLPLTTAVMPGRQPGTPKPVAGHRSLQRRPASTASNMHRSICASTCRYIPGRCSCSSTGTAGDQLDQRTSSHAESCMQHQCHSAAAEQCGCARGPATSTTTCDGVRLRLIYHCMHSHSSGASITSAVYQWAYAKLTP